MGLVERVYQSRLISKLVRNDAYYLRRLVSDSDSVLDIGCGRRPQVLDLATPSKYLGVDVHEPSIQALRESDRFTLLPDSEARVMKIADLTIEENSFDVVLCLDVIEHLTRGEGLELLENLKRWAKRVVLVSTPNGFLRQDPYDGNDFQMHLSGWTVDDFYAAGFQRIFGGGGLRSLRRSEMQPDQWSHQSSASMRFRPRILWALVSAMIQPISFRFPRLCFQLYAIAERK
jgi:2-polyprenyl-3-methyl-5-hydroxy-6-metoxy-1,4-benzoquinol methylase